MTLSLQLRGQEVEVVEVVVAKGVAIGRCDACIGIGEVLVGGTVTIGGNYEILSVSRLHHLYAAGTATRTLSHDGEAVVLHECGELVPTRECYLTAEYTDIHAAAVELGIGVVLLIEHAVEVAVDIIGGNLVATLQTIL